MIDTKKFITPGKVRKCTGKLTVPESSGHRVVLNPMTVKGDMESPTNKTLATRWKKVRDEGRAWAMVKTGFKAGEHQVVAVQSDIWVANVVLQAEDGTYDKESVNLAFKKLGKTLYDEKASLHISESDYNNDLVKDAVKNFVTDYGVQVYLYPES